MSKNNTAFNLTIKMNGKEVKNTLNGVGKELRSLRARTKNLTEGTEEWYKANKELAKAEKTYDDLKKSQRELLNETKKNIDAQEDHNAALNDFTQGFGQLFSSIRSGDLVGAREGFNGITSGIKGATRAALAFIATPIGAAIASLTALFFAGREIFNFNQGLELMNKELRALGVSSEEMGKVRDEVKATASTFNKEFKDIAKTAKSLSESFGISLSEANDVIAQGLADGGRENAEFLDSLSEYDEFFARAGFAAQDFADIINQGYELGIYTDKLPDALKEADLSLREQTAATREALVNAFGATFTDDILDRIDKGETTTKEALEEISEAAEDSGLSMQQQAQLTADVFRGAGEDAGGALKILEAVGQAAQRELSETAKAELELQEANEELNKAQAELFGIESFGDLWIKVKTMAVQAITFILNYYNFLKNGGITVAESIANAFVWMNNKSIDVLIKLANKAKPILKALGFEVDAIVAGLNAVKLDKVNFSSDDSSVGPDQEQEEQAKKQAEQLRKQQEAQAAAIKKKEELQKKAAEAEKKRLEELDKLQAEYLKKKEERLADSEVKKAELEKERALQEAERLKASQELMDQIKAEHDVKIAEAKVEEEEKELARIREFEARKQEVLDEIELAQAETEEEKKIIKEEQRLEKELQQLENLKLKEEEKNELVELMTQKHEDRLLQIEKEANEKRSKENQKFYDDLIAAEENLQAAKNNALHQGLGVLQGFFDESSGIYKALFAIEKGFAAAEVITNTSKSLALISANTAAAHAAAVAASPLTLGQPIAGMIATTGIKNAAAVKINAAVQLASIASQAIKGFAKGGFTDAFGMGQIDESGKEVAGVVHKNEYVVPEFVRAMPGVPPILEYLESKRIKALGSYANGGDTAIASNSSINDSSELSNETLINVLNRIDSKLDMPLRSEILFGYEAELKRQEVQKELEIISNKSSVKKNK